MIITASIRLKVSAYCMISAMASFIVAWVAQALGLWMVFATAGTLEYGFPSIVMLPLIALFGGALVGGQMGHFLGLPNWLNIITSLAAGVAYSTMVFLTTPDFSAVSTSLHLPWMFEFLPWFLAWGLGVLVVRRLQPSRRLLYCILRIAGALAVVLVLLVFLYYPVMKGEYRQVSHLSDRVQALGQALAESRGQR